jgi:MFS family permease
MIPAHQPTARQEWARHWPLPITALLGVAGMSVFAYAHGVFLNTMVDEFGWARSEFSSAFTIQMLVGLALAPLVGRLVDRFGPRRVALAGLLPYALALALLGLTNGSVVQWQLLCLFLGAAAAFVSPPVWITAVVMRFNASRGMAMATGLAGLGAASMVWPVVAALLLSTIGWRLAFPAIAAAYLVVMVPLTLLFMPRGGPRGTQDEPASDTARADKPEAGEVLAAFRSRALICVVLAGALFSTVTLGLNFHMVPFLRSRCFDLATAASAAGVLGLASLCGRLLQPQLSLAMIFFAVVIYGLASGAETDVVSYLISRHFQPIFGTVFAISFQIFGVLGSMGPLVAATIFDATGSYDPFIMLIPPVVTLGALLIWLHAPGGSIGSGGSSGVASA